MRRTATETREHVLRVAQGLFYWQGIRSTGVDKIAEEAGVAPTTLYRLFASKDDLVAAYVDRADQEHREWFTAAIQNAGPDPRDQILALFDEIVRRIQPDQCRGCPFLMTLAEFPDRGLPAHRHAVAQKAWVRERLRELAAELARGEPVGDHGVLADRLALVMEGVYASVQALGVGGPVSQVQGLVESILDQAVRTGRENGSLPAENATA